MPPKRCCVEGCQSTAATTRMYAFPRDRLLISQWIRLIESNFPWSKLSQVRGSKKICRLHFEDKYITLFDGSRIRDAIPTLFKEEEIISRVPSQEIVFVRQEDITIRYKQHLRGAEDPSVEASASDEGVARPALRGCGLHADVVALDHSYCCKKVLLVEKNSGKELFTSKVNDCTDDKICDNDNARLSWDDENEMDIFMDNYTYTQSQSVNIIRPRPLQKRTVENTQEYTTPGQVLHNRDIDPQHYDEESQYYDEEPHDYDEEPPHDDDDDTTYGQNPQYIITNLGQELQDSNTTDGEYPQYIITMPGLGITQHRNGQKPLYIITADDISGSKNQDNSSEAESQKVKLKINYYISPDTIRQEQLINEPKENMVKAKDERKIREAPNGNEDEDNRLDSVMLSQKRSVKELTKDNDKTMQQDNITTMETVPSVNNIELPPFSGLQMDRKFNRVLLAATGSVAAMKIPLIVQSLRDNDFEVQLVVTEHAKHFFEAKELPADVPLHDDSKEWSTWQQRGDPVLHIELGKWADMMVIAPLDANTLAKMSQGICDNLLTSTTRAWSMSKPLLFCPAMNTRMWEHPLTSQQLDLLESWGHEEIPPIEKTLMCGETGVGAMAEVETILLKIMLLRTAKESEDSDNSC